ncbi:45 kda calcium-binding protein [Plakobranchus ocellatus]|uniref:45 kDa calcium-binding protein n=1 Tax=Plakobranchus ocellatus TaxID=259542 RepID=A0AAV3ZMK6_9GAST|nr:45 kda calcium-binding protein [Plakobranchus ocellatus]
MAGKTRLEAEAGETRLNTEAVETKLGSEDGETKLGAEAGECRLSAGAGETRLRAEAGETRLSAEAGEIRLVAEAGEIRLGLEAGAARLNSNGDQIITEEEFAALPPGDVENEEFRQMDLKWQTERRKEFNEIMDIDHNKKVTFEELKNYLDPTNPLQAKLEADSLISLMDDDKNDLLSMDEILKHSDLFISSKVVNFVANIHEEL